jgi:hypothetical protein
MRTSKLALAGAVGLLLVGAAVGAQSFKGQEAPDIQVNEWVNGDGRNSLADFRGEVVYLEFWKSH